MVRPTCPSGRPAVMGRLRRKGRRDSCGATHRRHLGFGRIQRDPAVGRAFQASHPCPSTGRSSWGKICLTSCSRSNIEFCKPAAWLSGLIYQLAAQFPEYRSEIERFQPPNWGDPPESLFRTLVADPLCASRARSAGAGEPWVFAIDGLDESVAAAGPALADLIAGSAERIPDWLRLIVTSRPDRELSARFRTDGVRGRSSGRRAEPGRGVLEGIPGRGCHTGLIEYLRKDHRETAAGLATQLARIHSLKGDYTSEAERHYRKALRLCRWWAPVYAGPATFRRGSWGGFCFLDGKCV
jgi:hypothetical protein